MIPVTPNVEDNVVAAVTPRVPATDVFPFDAVTTNLFELTDKSPVIPTVLEKVAPEVTPNVDDSVVAPDTFKVPAMSVFPVDPATVNLFVFTVIS